MDWEDLGQKIADAGKDVSGRMKKAADLVCLKQKLSNEERKLQTAYMEIGKLYYESHEGEIDEKFIPLFENAAAAAAAAADYKEQISQAKNQVQCPSCGAYQSADAAFCNQCGASLKSDDDVQDM